MKYLSLVAVALPLLALLTACGTSAGPASHPATQRLSSASTASAQAKCSAQLSQWTPVGQKWKLTVEFKVGSRAGQQETSLMTFLPDGTLTATFPSPTGQDILSPAVDGHWCATGSRTFAYTFKDQLMQGGKLFAYVQTAITATMTSPGAYTGDGVGVIYEVANDMPLPGQYNVTQTTAVAMTA